MDINDYYIKERLRTASRLRAKEIDNVFFQKHLSFYIEENDPIIIKPSQIFLFESIDVDHEGEKKVAKVFKPEVAIFHKYQIWDQAIVLDWIPYPRVKYFHWEDNGIVQNISFKTINEICWGDSFSLIYDVWDVLPDWKTLRDSYYKTWTYRKSREDVIDSVLNS